MCLIILLVACGGADPTPTVETVLPEIATQEITTKTAEPIPTSGEDEEQLTGDSPTPTETAIPEVPAIEPTNTQEQELTFEVIPKWNAGDNISLELVKERTDSNQGVVQLEISSRTPVDIRVLEKIDDGYVLQWTFGETVIDSGSTAANPTMDAFLNLGNGMSVEYEVDQWGSPTKVINWEEIKTTMESALNEIISGLEKQGLNQEELIQIRALVEPMFSSQEQIETFATQEILVYHLVYGWPPFESSTPLAYDDILPNPFGGEPFPSVGQIELADYESGMGKATINWSQKLDPESARQILLQTLTDIATAMGSDPPNENDLLVPFVIEDSGEFVVDSNSGWVESVDQVRKIEIGPSSRVESLIFIAITN
jgi:hypothetical protein